MNNNLKTLHSIFSKPTYVVLALVLAGRLGGDLGLGQSVAATVIVVDTIVAVVGLALAVQVRRHFGTLDASKISTLRG